MRNVFKNLIVVFIIEIVSVYCSTAQKTYTVQSWGGPKKPHIGTQLQKMKDALTLSEEQVTKIQALVKESHAQAKASTTTDPKIKKTEEKDRLKALEVSIIGVLTAEQAKKYEQWKIEQKAELKSKRQEKKEQK